MLKDVMMVHAIGLMLAQAMMVLIPLALSLSVHEWAHAFTAKRLGDDTAERAGRLTLNPLAHVDPVGTVALPLLILLMQGSTGMTGLPLFGWAKPTPINAGRFTRRISARRGATLVALAGPLSNVVLALMCCAVIVALQRLAISTQNGEAIVDMCLRMIFMNAGLAVFNLLPLHPLDGETVVSGLLPYRASIAFERFNAAYGSLALWVVVLAGRGLLRTPVLFVARSVLNMVTLLS
jgi:Zn-dependent protease